MIFIVTSAHSIFIDGVIFHSAMESGLNKKEVIKAVLPSILGLVVVGLALTMYAWKKKRLRARRQGNVISFPNWQNVQICTFICVFSSILMYYFVGNLVKSLSEDYTGGGENNNVELPFFSFSEISKVTNNFSVGNKLGEGGFGPVYKVTCSSMTVLYQIAVSSIRKKNLFEINSKIFVHGDKQKEYRMLIILDLFNI